SEAVSGSPEHDQANRRAISAPLCLGHHMDAYSNTTPGFDAVRTLTRRKDERGRALCLLPLEGATAGVAHSARCREHDVDQLPNAAPTERHDLCDTESHLVE